ncbi:MAG: Fibronectin type domain, partial [Microbacteriaceae bacterium]|nr:Fibronectin type domain [Microbacteriaceae bacterium]
MRNHTIALALTTALTVGAFTALPVAAFASGDDATPTVESSDSVLSAPEAPEHVTVTPVDADSVRVTWRAEDDGGSPITGFTVVLTSADASTSSSVDVAADVTSQTFTGLVSNTGYTATVSATNSVGTSAATVSGTART